MTYFFALDAIELKDFKRVNFLGIGRFRIGSRNEKSENKGPCS